MFRHRESEHGVIEYYVTKSGQAVRLEPDQPPPNAFDLPSIRPLLGEKEVKSILYQLFDRHATKVVGVMHGKDVNYLELRKSRESVRALSRASGQKFDVLPGSVSYDEGMLRHPDLSVMSREEVARALHSLYHPSAPSSPTATKRRPASQQIEVGCSSSNSGPLAIKKRRQDTSTGSSDNEASIKCNAAGSLRAPSSQRSYHDEASSCGTAGGPCITLAPPSSGFLFPSLVTSLASGHRQHCPKASSPGLDEVQALHAKLHVMEERMAAQVAESQRTSWDLDAFIRQARKRLPLAFLFRTAGRTWMMTRLAAAFRTWKLMLDDEKRAAETFKSKAPKALHIQRLYRGMKGRQRYKHIQATQLLLSCIARAVMRHGIRLHFDCLKRERAAWQALQQRRKCAAIMVQAYWRGFRYGRCQVRYMRCKALLQALRDLGGGHLFRLHRIKLGKVEETEVARTLDLALSPWKPLRDLPQQADIRQALLYVRRCKRKMQAAQAGKARATAKSVVPASRHNKSPPRIASPPPGERHAGQVKVAAVGSSGSLKPSPGTLLGLRAIVREPTWTRPPPGMRDTRVDAMKAEGLKQREVGSEAKEREIMHHEDYKSRQALERSKEARERADREARERANLKKVSNSDHSSSRNKNKGGGTGKGAMMATGGAAHQTGEGALVVLCVFELDGLELEARAWPVYSSRGAAVKESLWVLRTSELMLAVRRRCYFAAVQARKKAEEEVRRCTQELRQLKVKMMMERRDKESQVARVKTELTQAQESESTAARDLRAVLLSHVKTLGSALKVKPPKKFFTSNTEDIVALTAAVADWTAQEGSRFVQAKLPPYVEALQRFCYLSSPVTHDGHAHMVDPADPRWAATALKATHLDVLEALASCYALHLEVFNLHEDPLEGNADRARDPLLSVVVEEETVVQLLGRRSYSQYLHRQLEAEAHKISAATSDDGDQKQQHNSPLRLDPGEKEVREHQHVLARLVELVRVEEATGALRLATNPKRHSPIKTGPTFEWTLQGFRVCVRALGLLDVQLEITSLAQDGVAHADAEGHKDGEAADSTNGSMRTIALSKETAALAISGFALSRLTCLNCINRAAEVACASKRCLCRPCLGLLHPSEVAIRHLPDGLDLPALLLPYIHQAFPQGPQPHSQKDDPAAGQPTLPSRPASAAIPASEELPASHQPANLMLLDHPTIGEETKEQQQ